MPELPMHYRTAYVWKDHAADGVVEVEQRPALPVGTPHDLARFCPEHLLVIAAETCLANYVLLIADRSKLEVRAYRSSAEGELEKDERGLFRFKHIRIRAELSVTPGSEALAQRVLEKAHRSCLVARSLTCPVEVEPVINT